MSVKVKFRCEGFDRLDRFLSKFPDNYREYAQSRLLDWAGDVRDDARRFVHKKTHSLEKSIRVENKGNSSGVLVSLAVRAGGYVVNPETGKLVDYAGFQEFGTSRMQANPYMRPAFELHRVEIERGMRLIGMEACKQSE